MTQYVEDLLKTPVTPGPSTWTPPTLQATEPAGFMLDPLATRVGAGQFFNGLGPFPKGYNIESQWMEVVDGGQTGIFVATGSLGEPGRPPQLTDQGAVFVTVVKWGQDFLPDPNGVYLTPAAAGSLRIADAQGERLILLSTNGTTFYFDVPSRQFVDSLTAPNPPTFVPRTPTPSLPVPVVTLPPIYP